MERAEKREFVAGLHEVFKASGSVVVAHYSGLTVAQMNDLRSKMRAAGGTVKVAKNRLAKIALQGTESEGIVDLFKGQTLIAYSDDPVTAPKVAMDFAKTNDKLVYEVHKSWSYHVDSWTAQKRPGLAVLRYEDMLADPLRAFGGLVQFMGLNPPRARLERAIERSSFKALRQQEDQKGFKEKSPFAQKFFREGRAEQWREKLTPAQVDKVVEAHKEQMRKFGYWPLK